RAQWGQPGPLALHGREVLIAGPLGVPGERPFIDARQLKRLAELVEDGPGPLAASPPLGAAHGAPACEGPHGAAVLLALHVLVVAVVLVRVLLVGAEQFEDLSQLLGAGIVEGLLDLLAERIGYRRFVVIL